MKKFLIPILTVIILLAGCNHPKTESVIDSNKTHSLMSGMITVSYTHLTLPTTSLV